MTTEPTSLGMDARNRLRLIVNRTTDLTPLKSVATKAIQLAEDERSAEGGAVFNAERARDAATEFLARFPPRSVRRDRVRQAGLPNAP